MSIKKCVLLIITCIFIQLCGAPPVTKQRDEEKETDGLEDYMEYHRYLREVVTALESDPEFRKKLEQANEDDIRSGKIAKELEYVSHHVRTRLDEIKRTEMARLRDLVEKKKELLENNAIDDPNHHHHIDHKNPHTFEIEDLKKLIAKTTEDLAEADRKRRDEFKEYEMQKEMEKQVKLNHTNGDDERHKLEKEYEDLEKKHKTHEKLHEPGHKQQLEEVWEEQDHMQQDFDPKTFFMLHDLDGNGLWDQDEVKALFIKELDKMYSANAPEDDMKERMEEMERMRESVFAEVDVNKDGFIDYDEFLEQTKRNDFQQDNGWKGLDEERPYTDEEFAEYMKNHQEMLANQIPQYGQVPPHMGQVPGGVYQQPPPHPGQGQIPPTYQQQQFHPGQLPQAQVNPQHLPHVQVPPNYQNIPHYQNELNTNEIYQGNPNYQQHPGQPNFQQPPGQPNFNQMHQGQINQAQNMQHPAQNVQQNQGQNVQHPAQNVQHPPQNVQQNQGQNIQTNNKEQNIQTSNQGQNVNSQQSQQINQAQQPVQNQINVPQVQQV